MLLSLVSAILLLLLIIIRKHITAAVGVIPLAAVALYSYATDPSYWFIVPLAVLLAWLVVKARYKDYDYDHKIISLMPNLNKNQGRTIGKVLPVYHSQIKYNNSMVVQSDLSCRGGTLITGSSGSGKTYGMLSLIHQDLDAGHSVAFFDFKGDVSTLEEIEREHPDIPIYKISWEGCDFIYDPLINLDEGGKVEALLNIRKWSLEGSDDHYKTNLQLLLQKIIREYDHKEGNYLLGLYNFLMKYNCPKEHWDAYITMKKLIELTVTSKVSSMFNSTGREFSFQTNEQFILLVSFTSSTKALATSISSMMFRDLIERGTRSSYDPGLCLYVDEFGSAESQLIIKDILEKGRSCGISTTLAMQDILQLAIKTNEFYVDSVLGTINSYIIYAGATKSAAEKLAGVQVQEIEPTLMLLKKPINGKPPTAVFISKYPVFKKQSSEWYCFVPYDYLKKRRPTEDKSSRVATNTKQDNEIDLSENESQLRSGVSTFTSVSEETLQPQEEQTQSTKFKINIDDFI